jgi:hypothetical protein
MPEFKKIHDYYDYLLGNNVLGNDIMNFISSHFARHCPKDTEDDLQYALIETTSRNNRQHIGETVLFGGPSHRGKDILEIYEKIILSMSAKYKFSPADIEEWYQREYSYLLISNNGEPKNPVRRPQWHTKPGHVPKDKTKHDHPKKNVSEEDFLEYLNEYGERLHKELSVADYPHYCVIVKPLSLRKKDVDEYLPIGNLYLLFCTKTYHNENFYADLINNLVLVWLNCNWETLLTELKQREIKISQYLPNLKPAILDKFKTTKVSGHTMDRYYELFFDDSKQPQQLEMKYAKVIDLAFAYFHKEYLEKKHWPAELGELITNGGKKAVTIDTLETELEKILLMRMFALVATQVFGLPLPNLTTLLQTGYTTTSFKPDTAITNFLHVQRWLTPGANTELSRADQGQLSDHILLCTSYHEKTVLNEAINKIKNDLDPASETHRHCLLLSEKIINMLLGKFD